MNSLKGSLKIRREETDDGLVILVNERSDSELIVIQGTYPSGPAFDPEKKPGLSRFTSEMMMRGTKKRKYRRIIDEVESLGAGIRFYSGDDVAWSSARCTPQTLDKTLEILFDCTANPVFPEEEVEKVRGIILTRIMQREDSTAAVANRIAREMLFPVGNPYHHDPGGYEDSISGISREDVISFHEKQYGKNSAILTFSGKITLEGVLQSIQRHSSEWELVEPGPRVPDISVKRPVKPRKKHHQMPQKSQADIAIMCPAPERTHVDHYALDLGNTILGKIGLMGRLGKSIREKQGLAYYATSLYVSRITCGYWIAYAGVNPANVDRALEGIYREMGRISEEPVMKREYSDVLTNRIGNMALRLETCSGAAGFMQTIERHGLGLDLAERYEGKIRSITQQDIQRACSKYIRSDGAVTAIAGP